MDASAINYSDPEVGHIKLRQSVSTQCMSNMYEIMDLEIPVGATVDGCRSVCRDKSGANSIPLYKYTEIPAFLQGNPWVVDGYRSIMPFSQCCRSLFVWNNETINIWSHLGGCFLFFLLTIYDNVIGIPMLNGTISDHIVITAALLCFQFCMLCSAGYHTFMCHSERASRRWLAMDLTGISVGLIGCYIPGVHYAFYCLSVWRDVYLITVVVLFGAVLLFQTTPRYLSSQWFYRRILLYVALVGYGIIPTIHWVLLNGGLTAKLVQIFLPKVTVMYILGLIAFLFYFTKIPERLCPGLFDYVGSSHQCWHVMVVITFLWWHQAGRDLLAYYSEQKICMNTYTS